MTTSGMWDTKTVDIALHEVSRRLRNKGIRVRVFSVMTSFEQLRHSKLSEHLQAYEYVIVPICESGHYVAFVVRDGWIYYYDSLTTHDYDLGYFDSKWVYRWRDYIRTSMGTTGVKFSVMRQPRQTDAVRCAAYMLSFIAIAPQLEVEDWPIYTNKHLEYACRLLDASAALINNPM